MNKGFFVTGTDTEVGKTLVSSGIIQLFVDAGEKVVGMKPVASGSLPTAQGLRSEDAATLIAPSNCEVPYDMLNPYCFEPPIAPHIAALRVGQRIELAKILTAYNELRNTADVVIVEGVGGWMVPIDGCQTMADVAVAMDLPVIMVVGIRLGCINHALLTYASIKASGLEFKGWVANIMDPNVSMVPEILNSIQIKMHEPLLGLVPPMRNVDASQVSQCLAKDLIELA